MLAITCTSSSPISTMRIRIQTFSPLPELKAWFIPEIQDAHETVFDLKELLCKGIPQLRANQIDARYLILLLEGFELLNDSPISAVRDGDLIIVKMLQRTKEYVDEPRTQFARFSFFFFTHLTSVIPASHSRKRKRNPNEFEDKSPIKVSSSRGAPTPQASSAYQNVSQSSESEQSSSSDSEPNTSDSSSNSSSSTSSSDSSPTTHPVNNVIIPPQLGKHQLSRDRPPKCVLRLLQSLFLIFIEEERHIYLLVKVNLRLIHGTRDEGRRESMINLRKPSYPHNQKAYPRPTTFPLATPEQRISSIPHQSLYLHLYHSLRLQKS